MQDERERLEEEGFTSEEVVRLQPKRVWYRSDGSAVGMLPVDTYHSERFRAKGWTLASTPAPVTKERHYLGFKETPAEPVVEEN